MLDNTYLIETDDGNATIIQGRNKKHVLKKFKAQETFYSVDEITSITKLDITTLLNAYYASTDSTKCCFV